MKEQTGNTKSKETTGYSCDGHKRYIRRPNIAIYKYRNLARVLYNKYGTMNEAARKIGWGATAIGSMLKGQSVPKKNMIDDILAATGLKYEEAFAEDYE